MASFVETQGHAGDEGNFEALYSTYRSEVQRLASYLLRNTADAEDASQTVFVNVLRALRQGARPAEPRAWLMAITRNVCFSRRRAAAARPDEVELDPERVPEQNGDDAPSVDDIVGALARMLPNQRTALILRDFRGAPHNEICDLMELSPAGAETLLTRARASFRQEIEAGEQPFDCAETKSLVEQQLAGMISTAERHSLRTHLRHCSRCATLARAMRSSAGKAASLLLFPIGLISRLAGAFSQAQTAVQVGAAVTSTAAVAAVAIPVAVTHAPVSNHVEGATAPAPAVVRPASRVGSKAAATTAATTSHTSAASFAVGSHAPAAARPARLHVQARLRSRAAHAGAAKPHRAAALPVRETAPATPVTAHGGGFTATAPRTAEPVVISHESSPPAAATDPAVRPSSPAPRGSSPAARPSAKPRAKPKAKPKARAPRRRGGGRHPTDPADRMPASQAPASTLPAPANGADNGAGPGYTAASSSTSSQSSTSSDSSSSNGGGGANPDATTGSSNGGDSGSGKKPKSKKR